MKKASDPRHLERVRIMQVLFQKPFHKNLKLASDSQEAQILSKRKEIDRLIAKNAPAWPIEQIAPIDLATLRLAIWELLYKTPEEPYKVIVDEAVEIAKAYGSESSSSFINGVLGSIIKAKPKTKIN